MSTKHTTFKEYIDNKGKLRKTPKVEEVPCFDGKANNPPKDTHKHKNIKKGQVQETFKTYAEYLNSKGVLQTGAIEDKTGDQVDMPNDLENAPPAHVTKGKNWNDKEILSSKPASYKAPSSSEKPPRGDFGLGDMGDRNLKFKYNTDIDKNSPNGGPKAAAWTKTEAFIEKTKHMNSQEFADYMLNECGCGGGMPEGDDTPYITVYRIGKVQPDPFETIRYISSLATSNPNILNGLIREIKRKEGGMPLLMDQMMGHPETYSEIARLLDDEKEGLPRAKKMTNALNDNYSKYMESFMMESVSAPVHKDDDEEMSPEGEDEELPPEEGDEEMPEENPDDEMLTGDDEMPDDDEEGDEEDSLLPDEDEENPDEMPPEEGDEESPYPEMPPEEEPEMPKMPKPKRKFGHHNMLNAMKEHSYMREAMKNL